MSRKRNRKKIERREPIKAFSGSGIDKRDDVIKINLGNIGEITALGKEEAKKIVGIFIAASLPRLMRFGEENGSAKLLLQFTELSKLGAVVERKAMNRQPIKGVENSLSGGSGVF